MFGLNVHSLDQSVGGRNSKVYKIFCGNPERVFIVKQYYRDDSDKRDRINVEFNALNFLWDNGVRVIPRPIAANPEKGYAVYEYIEGSNIDPKNINNCDISQVVEFLALLKNLTEKKDSMYFPDASEACFAINDIHYNLELRLGRLKSIKNSLLQVFLKNELLPLQEQIFFKTKQLACRNNSFYSPLTRDEKTFSSSDFGFHNALKDERGKIFFLDFEYFGWDDPAKTICDFLLHPAMQLNGQLQGLFLQKIIPVYNTMQTLKERLITVYPLYILKWCVILLNEFLPERLARRRFSLEKTLDTKKIQAEQLQKARLMLKKVEDSDDKFTNIK